MENTSILFESLSIRHHTFRNRIVLPPMVTNRNIVGIDGRKWYGERARHVALVIVEAVSITRFGEELRPDNLARLVNSIHEGGALAAIQLFPIQFDRRQASPADLTRGEISGIIKNYERASRICVEAGFDAVEPHGAHGFVLNQFFSPVANTRTDEYGGSQEARMRLGMEVVAASRKGLGTGPLLLYRHTPVQQDAYAIDESLEFAAKLVDEGVDILDISPASENAPADRAAPFKALGVPVIAVNEMDRVERAVETLAEKRADFIAVGRGLIADPEWPLKIREGRFEEIVVCQRCNEKCFGYLRQGLPIECSQWEESN